MPDAEKNEALHLLAAELMFDAEPPRLNKPGVTESLKAFCGEVIAISEDENLFYAFPGHMVTFSDGKSIPAQAVIIDYIEERKGVPSARDAALHQAWDWPEARQIAPACKWHVFATEMMSSTLDRRERLKLFHGVVQALLKVTANCRAILWMSSERYVNPVSYLDQRSHGNDALLEPAINVRMFNISGGAPGEKVMDTLGLATLGLPDVQCHFVGLEPDKVAPLLYNAANYLFEQGDVIQDGHTTDGIEPGQKWRCQHEMALIGPERAVLDINPGMPFAAAGRS